MYASITNIIPDLEDQTRISGRILLKNIIVPFIYHLSVRVFRVQSCYMLHYMIYMDSPWFKFISDMVDRDKKVVEKFEFDPAKITAFDACDSIWKMINSR